ncbi:uncharacterized protein PRCAT00004447001 [Priceomyces carsonii]|uniref:uncharacterized protein n=1 Tax=Priceomyces carsonii TaxID=28549 RepID=UPI002EDA4AE0|nr:unnamed protein product [Priceomyces carsonii]
MEGKSTREVSNEREITLNNGDEIFIRRASNKDQSRIATETNLFFKNTHLSKLHASLKLYDDYFYLKDCNSTFGTVINDEYIASESWFRLSDNDTIGFIISKPSSAIEKIVSKFDKQNTIPLKEFSDASIALSFKINTKDNCITFLPLDKDASWESEQCSSDETRGSTKDYIPLAETFDSEGNESECSHCAVKCEMDDSQPKNETDTIITIQYQDVLPNSESSSLISSAEILGSNDNNIAEGTDDVEPLIERRLSDNELSFDESLSDFSLSDLSEASTIDEDYSSEVSVDYSEAQVKNDSGSDYASSDNLSEYENDFKEAQIDGCSNWCLKDLKWIYARSFPIIHKRRELYRCQNGDSTCCQANVKFGTSDCSEIHNDLDTLEPPQYDSGDFESKSLSKKRKYDDISDSEIAESADVNKREIANPSKRVKIIQSPLAKTFAKELAKGFVYALATITALGIYGSKIASEQNGK